jgi:hypothetical protein
MLPVTTASWALRQAASSDITRPTSRTLNPQRQAARRDLLLGKQNSPEGRWNVIEGERRNRVWPPLHRRDLQRRSLPRIDPADRCVPTWPLERIRRATAICHLQRDVFIKRSGLDLIPAIVARWPHYQRSSRCRTIAGLSGFFTLIQSFDGPDLYGALSRFDTMPSRPILRAC